MLLNRSWRAAASCAKLYAFQLSRCPSISLSHGVICSRLAIDHDLPRLQKLFAREAKRNLFDVFLRPCETIVNLYCGSASSSAASPRGEAFRFFFSPHGRLLLIVLSSKIFVLDIESDPVRLLRRFETTKRPLSAVILDDGSLFAVLATDQRVRVYDVSGSAIKHLRTISLEEAPRTLALSPAGTVLAVAYNGGIEVYSLAAQAAASDRRAVKCDAVDKLVFSDDGTLLLGTTLSPVQPHTVLITASYLNHGGADLSPRNAQSQMWTTQILFPNSNLSYSNAALLPTAAESGVEWLFIHDKLLDSFRAVSVDDLRRGTTFFSGPKCKGPRSEKPPSSPPATTRNGEVAAVTFAGKEVWLYGRPEVLDFRSEMSFNQAAGDDLDMGPDTSSSIDASISETPSLVSTIEERYGPDKCPPRWQFIVDREQNVIVRGYPLKVFEDVSALQWVWHRQSDGPKPRCERLVAALPCSAASSPGGDVGPTSATDRARLMVWDFRRSAGDNKQHIVDIELGEANAELLQEEEVDIELEMTLARRGTVPQNRDSGAEDRGSPSPSEAPAPGAQAVFDDEHSRRDPLNDNVSAQDSIGIIGVSLEEPYSHNQPRPATNLHRTATAAVISSRQQVIVDRAPGSRSNHDQTSARRVPHESDADNWVPPPPPYTPDPETPLPEHLRLSLLPRRAGSLRSVSGMSTQIPRANTTLENMAQTALQRTRSTVERVGSGFRVRRPSLSRGYFETGDSRQLRDTDLRTPSYHPRPSSGTSARTVSAPFRLSTVDNVTLQRPLSASRVQLLRGTPAHGNGSPSASRLTSPISPIPEPISYTNETLPTSRTRSSRDTESLILSGSYLQERLNCPVPPVPSEPNVSGGIPPTAAAKTSPLASPSITLPPAVSQSFSTSSWDSAAIFAPAPPSAEQLAALHGRYDQTTLLEQRSRRSSRGSRRDADAASLSSPPRAALGAAGQQTQRSRRHSRGSSHGRSSPAQSFSASTPNLVRPSLQRLETIQSVASGQISTSAHGEASRSRSEDLLRPTLSRDTSGVTMGAESSSSGRTEGKGRRRGGKCVIM